MWHGYFQKRFIYLFVCLFYDIYVLPEKLYQWVNDQILCAQRQFYTHLCVFNFTLFIVGMSGFYLYVEEQTEQNFCELEYENINYMKRTSDQLSSVMWVCSWNKMEGLLKRK